MLNGLVASLLVVAGCEGAPSPLQPAGPAAARIADLAYVIFGLAGVVFVVVEGLLLFAILRYRRAQATGEPRQIYGGGGRCTTSARR